MAYFKRIVQIGIQAWNLAQILSKDHFLGKRHWPPKIQHGGDFFKSNARYVNCSNSDVGITFSENTLLRMFFLKNGACPSKILDGNHFSRWQPFFKMAAISLEPLHQFFKWWCYHHIWYKYSSRKILMEKGVCHSKIKDGDHFQDCHHFCQRSM